MRHFFLLPLFAVATCCFLNACSDNPQNMVPDLSHTQTFPGSANVKVTGGKESNPGAMTNLTDKEFKAAVELSLEKIAAFNAIKRDGPADYQMEIAFTSNEPAAGFDMTITVHASWVLIRRSDDTVVWKKSVDSSCKKTVGDAFAGGTRLIMAEEGAIKQNISIALDSLQNTKIP